MGPSAGSGTLAGVAGTNLVSMNLAGGGAVLSTSTFTAPVTIATNGQTTTLTVPGAATAGPMVEVGSLPVFTRTGSAAPALQGSFIFRESGAALSLTPSSPSGPAPAAPAATDADPGRTAPFTMTLENVMVLQMTAAVSRDGVLVVTAPAGAGVIDV